MTDRRFVAYQEVLEFLTSTQVTQTVKSPITEPEVKYFLAARLFEPRGQFDRSSVYACIGDRIVYVTDVPQLLTWMEGLKQSTSRSRNKKKKVPTTSLADVQSMLPLILLCLSRPSTSHAIYQRFAKLYDLDIGNEMPLDSWKNQPSYWIKDVSLGEVKTLFEYRCACGLNHGHQTSYDSSDDEYYSDSDL